MRLAADDADDVYSAGLPGVPTASTWRTELIKDQPFIHLWLVYTLQ